MHNKIDTAVELFSSGFSCSQAVLAVFCEEFGMDKDTALRLATTFAGGLGGKGYVCGAVSGAYMVIGLKYGRTTADDLESKAKSYEMIALFDKKFKEKHHFLNCGELIGFEAEDYDEKYKLKDSGVFTERCPKYVESAVQILIDIL